MDIITIIKTNAFFANISEQGIQFLLTHLEPLDLKRGEFVFNQGDFANAIYLILDGRLLVTSPYAIDDIEIANQIQAGAIIGEKNLMAGKPYSVSVQALTDAKLVKLSKENYRILIGLYSQQDDLAALIRGCHLFTDLKDEECFALLSKVAHFKLEQDQVYSIQEQEAGYFYIIIKGKLSIEMLTKVGTTKTINTFEKGEIIDDIELTANKSQVIKVKAIFTSHVFKIAKEDFKTFCLAHPKVLFSMFTTTIAFSQRLFPLVANEKKPCRIAVILGNAEVNWPHFCGQFKEAAQHFAGFTLLDDTCKYSQQELHNITTIAEGRHDTLVYLISKENSSLQFLYEGKVEKIIIVTQRNKQVSFNELAYKFLHTASTSIRRELILLNTDNTKALINTKDWLEKESFHLHHHVSVNNLADYQRVWRFILGQAVGLVLSGGGARAWAEIGVIKALLEKGINIDAIGGTSAGAVVAACYTMTLNYSKTSEKFAELTSNTYPLFRLKNFTWPIISLLSAKSSTKNLHKIFEGVLIEEMPIPYFCVSCNLNQKRESVDRIGYLWEKLRRSLAVPGIIPPVVKNGQLYFDGALVNNLPVDIMRNLIGDGNTIIAVNLSELNNDANLYSFPLVLNLKDMLLYKLGLNKNKYKFPSFFDTFMRCLQVGAIAKERSNSLNADILINPDLKAFRLLDFGSQNIDKLINIGYTAALEQLKDKL